MTTEDFWTSKENQEKYGFKYYINESGIGCIVYDGDIDKLFEIAYSSVGYVRDTSDASFEESLQIIDYGVDGVGSQPNLYVHFQNYEDIEVRFHLFEPEFYPSDFTCPFTIPNSILTKVNNIARKYNLEFISTWNSLRPDCKVSPSRWIPNYRAINRIR